MYSYIAPCKDKPLAEADAGNNSQEDQADADSSAPIELRARYEREVPVKRIAGRLQKTARRLQRRESNAIGATERILHTNLVMHTIQIQKHSKLLKQKDQGRWKCKSNRGQSSLYQH